MSEPKRIALIPLAASAADAVQASLPTTKKDKKSATVIVKTHRFSLTLPDSTEKSCPEFNFADLISSLTKKKEGHATNGSTPVATAGPPQLDPFADDDEDQLRGIAKKFEEKYGLPASKKKKSRKYDDYVDLGAGYDENDPFIDNTDAYDEIVPAEVTTAHGGFYINSGALEFKPVEKRSDSESESESESSESESEDSLSEASTTPVSTNKKRRIIESDDEDSPEEIQLNGSEGEDIEAKKKKLRLDESNNVQQVKRKKLSSPPESGVISETSSVSAKKPRPSVKELLQHKRELEKAVAESVEKPAKNLNNNVSVPPTVAVSTPPPVKEQLQLKRDKEKDVVDLSISSKVTVETSAVTSDSSSDSSDSSSDSSESESGGDEDEDGRDVDMMKGENDPDAKLPNNLTPATLAVIEDIKKAAATSDQHGKCRFFSPEINRLLLAIELQARQYSCSKRQAIYTHLTGFLPCTKHTLLKRAKNLVLEDFESQLKPAIRKLQQSVEKVIGEQIERHATQCQRLADANPERYLEYYRYVWDPELEPAGGTDDEDKKPEKSSKTPQPRRRFLWSKEMRAILNKVVYLKADCFNWSKLRKETAAEYLLRFLDTEIRLLWPKGWMTAKILFKESHEAHSFVTSKSKLNPTIKKPSIPRSGLVDALALPLPVTPSALSLNAASTPVGASCVSKEIKKSQLKDRMLSATAQPVARQDSNSVHHRSDSAPNLSSGKIEKIRSEVGIPSTRTDNGVKLDTSKHRQRPDPTCSAARTEIHHITKDPNKASFRQSEISHSTNHSRTPDSNPTNNSRSDHTIESAKPRSETNISKGNPVQVRSDLGIIKNDGTPSTRVNKADSIKPRHDSNSARGSEGNKQSRADNTAASSDLKSSSVVRGLENKQSRWENITPSELKNRFDHVQNSTKVESTQNKLDANSASDVNSANNSKSGKNSKTTPAVGPSLNSLASFVDSGLRWTEPGCVLDLSDDQQQPRQIMKTAEPTVRAESIIVKDSVPKVEETEDQESLLQRDLAMVLEEISQITRLVENKDLAQAPPQMTKSSDSRTKSVIKTTGSLSTSHSPASAPSLTSNPSSRQSTTSGSVLPPKLTSAARTPPPPPLTVSTPVSRISNSPTGANTSVNLISPTQTHSSRTMSPISSDHLKSGSGQGKYSSSISKLLSSEFMTPPTAHSSSRHAAGNFFNSEHLTPEKRKPDATSTQQQPLPPLPAHQQHVSTNSIPRSSPNAMFRNYPSSSAQSVSTPTSSLTMRNSHSIESLIQTKKSPTESSSSHRSAGNVHPGQQTAQSQQLPQPSVSKHDPLSIFMTQKNSQKSTHGDYNYYTQPGTGHHQQSS